MVLGLTLFYAAIKFIDLYQGNDPNIRENNISDSFGADDYFTFTDDLKFRVAVGARTQGEKTLRYDPQIVRWVARMNSINDKGIITQTIFPMHDCTVEDFDNFHPL